MREKTRQERYNEKNVKQIKLNLNLKTDADIIEYLEASGNKQGTIKEALRKMIGQGANMKAAHEHAKRIDELYEQQSEIARSEGKQFEDYTVKELVLTAKNIIDIMGDWHTEDHADQNYKRGQLVRLRNFIKKWDE